MAVKEQNIGSNKPATEGGLEQLREDVHLDIDQAIGASEKRINAHTDQTIDEAKREIIHEFKAAVELIHNDLAGANKDEISLIKDKQKDHGHRINRLEHHAGLV